MNCVRNYLDCKGIAEGIVDGNRFVCKNCLENGEHEDFKPFKEYR